MTTPKDHTATQGASESNAFAALELALIAECERAMKQRDEFNRTRVSTASHGGSHDTLFGHILRKHGALAQRQSASADPQAPSQEAREYPPTDDTLAGLAAKHGFRPRWTGDQWLSDAPLQMRSLFDLCREVVDSDRKARQQGALDARRPMRWPKERDLFRADDMGEGQLRVLFDSDNDVIVALWPDGKPSVSVEFCCPGSGGGKSPRTREALIALMVAMEEDGATNRPHDAAITKGEPQP